MKQPADSVIYYGMALDPIHVGTGGYRLGRVDNSIVREPGTNLPKLPGTSLSGACRAYTAMVADRYRWERDGLIYSCAGQGQANRKENKGGHCGQYSCPVCVSFGFAGERSGFQGLAQFSDARILLFPVHSLAGPVWITCPAVLNDVKRLVNREYEINRGEDLQESLEDAVKLAPELKGVNNRINLGWLMLPVNGSFQFSMDLPISKEIIKRTVLVPDKLFAQIVNDNLEVRTSVSISPETGAAEDGALFTYEAIPRSTIFWFTVTYLNPKLFSIAGQTPAPKVNNQDVEVKDIVQKGLQLFKDLGIGGMNTRGMGRLQILWKEESHE